MATVTWDGSTDTDWGTAANWDTTSVPGTSDDVIIANVTNKPVIADGTNPTVNSIWVEASSQLTCGNNTITCQGERTDYAFNIAGTLVPNTSTVVLSSIGSDTYIKVDNGTLNNLTINSSGDKIKLANNLTVGGDLTITAGELDILTRNLTVTGGVSGAGTLTTNASEVSFGYLIMTGTYNATTHANGTILTDRSGPSAQLLMDAADIVHNDGLFVFKGSSGGSSYCALNGASDATNGLYNVEIDASSRTVNVSVYNLTIHNNLTVTAGTFNTTTDDWALTVGAALDVGGSGALTCNSSTVQCNGLRSQGGTVNLPDADGGLTIKGTEFSGYGIHDTSGSGNLVHNNGTVTWDIGGLSTMQAKSTFYNITTATSGTDLRWFGTLTLAGALTVAANTDVFEHASAGGNLTITGAVSVSGKLGNSDAYSAYEFGSLTIESGGEYHATDGTTTCKGAVNVKSSGTFTHNDGTFLWENTTGDSINGFGAGAPAFYNLEISSSTSNDIFPEWDFTVRNVFDTNGQQIWIRPASRDVTITMGFSDATAVSTGATTAGLKTGGYINSTLKSYQNHLNDIKIYGASQVYHAKLADAWLTFTHTSQADCTWYIKNLNVQSTFNTTHTAKTGSNAIVILDGDCEFTGVTVTGGDTLDLNGWVMTCSDTVTGLAGSSVFQDTAGNGILSCKTLNQSNTQSMSNSNLIITGVGTCDVQSQWKNVLYNLGSSTLSGYRGWGTNSNVIFGSGVLEQTTRDNTQYTINNIQIVGGATFTPVVGDKTLTVAGDWTSSGGLLGTSCLHCDASSNYYASSASINFRSDSARDYSVEFWMKPDSVTNSETDRLVHSDQKFAIWKYEDDIVFAPNYDVAFTASAVLTAGKWTHVACTWDASDNALEIFIDGKVVQTGTDTTTDKTGAASIRIGRKDDGTQEFDGYIDEVRLWEDKRTATEIKTDMFQGGTLANSGDLFARWSLDEGAGTSSTDSSSNSNNLTLNDAGGWIGAGTFTEGTSTVDMTGTGKTMTFNGDTEFYNLTVAGSGKTTNIYNKLNVASALYINSGGTLTHGGGTFQVSGGSSGYYPNVVCKGTYSANANFEDLYTFYWVGNSVSHVQPAGKFNYLIYDNAYNSSVNYDVTLAGNITGSNYVAINDACSLNTRSSGVNYNIDTARLIMRSTASLTLNNSTLKFTNTQGFDINYTGNTLSAGPGCTISGTNAATTFKSQNHWNVVGNITNLNVTNEELKVTGMVTDCTGLIHQMNPTQDADQQLDKDTADDRDVQFASLNMDRNTELVG